MSNLCACFMIVNQVCVSHAQWSLHQKLLWLPHHGVSSGCRLYKLPCSASQACCKVNELTMWTLVVLCSVIASYGVRGIVRCSLAFCVLSDIRLSSGWKDRLCVFIVLMIEVLSVFFFFKWPVIWHFVSFVFLTIPQVITGGLHWLNLRKRVQNTNIIRIFLVLNFQHTSKLLLSLSELLDLLLFSDDFPSFNC